MSDNDRNVKKIVSANRKAQSAIRVKHAVSGKPSEKVRKYFERKAYGKYE